VFEHHRKTIESLKAHFEKDSDCLAFIVNGSVARGDARDESDVDFFLVVGDRVFGEFSAKCATCIEAHEHCVPPCPEANGYLTSKAEMRRIRDQGNEIERWSFYQAKIMFSRVGGEWRVTTARFTTTWPSLSLPTSARQSI
jgi:hypothetical protein